ncbi:MAG TPA: alpha-amylase family glycosyl hydrolase, partial [Planctomycetaceae bacterium]
DGDGVGDLNGIRSRLDYLQWLGVDAVWLSPIYPSPMADFGYDISDYCDVHPLFGTLADFDRLLGDVHRRGMKLILDFVPNHTSDEHPWFREARSSRNSPKRDWYIWRDPAPGGGPPNNWLSNFGGSAWEYDQGTGQYYYHAFLKEQPDLNWRNPEVRAAMFDAMRFWLDRGVDGFRVDVIWHIVKDEEFRDNPRNPDYRPGNNPYHEFLETYTADRPEVHDVISEMRAVLDAYPERMMVGEIYLPVERLVAYYGEGGEGVHMPFNFQLVTLPWNAHTIAHAVNDYEAQLPDYGWPNWVLGNHDQPRIASRTGREQARVAAMLLLTLRGTPTLYYGDEIGMHNVHIPRNRVQDPLEKNVPGMGLGRDPQRTPMQWDSGPNAGFTPGEPWLPIAEDSREVNVEAQRDDPRSMLSFYRRLIELRRSEPALSVGAYECVPTKEPLFAYVRSEGGRRFLVVLNFENRPTTFRTDVLPVRGRIAASTHLDRRHEEVNDAVDLRGDEGLLIELR